MTNAIAKRSSTTSLTDYVLKAYNGHGAECLCVRCCLADMAAHVKAQGRTEPVGVDAVESERGVPSGDARPTPAWAAAPATGAQVSFIGQLQGRKEIDNPMTRAAVEALTCRAASQMIDFLLSLPDRHLAVAVPAPTTAAAPAPATEELSVGMYSRDGEVYKVQLSRESRRLYAKRLVDGTFEYAAGAIRILRASDRMTLEEAAAYGKRTGTCCVCGIELTNPESIEAGIGPICAKKF